MLILAIFIQTSVHPQVPKLIFSGVLTYLETSWNTSKITVLSYWIKWRNAISHRVKLCNTNFIRLSIKKFKFTTIVALPLKSIIALNVAKKWRQKIHMYTKCNIWRDIVQNNIHVSKILPKTLPEWMKRKIIRVYLKRLHFRGYF
jgi:hypothetical protein